MRGKAMEYPAKFTPDRTAGGFVVTFPDVPEAITQGDTIEEAMAMASEALELALTFYTEKWADLPVPGSLKRGMRMVRVPALSEAKFRLYSALRATGVRKIDLARRLRCSPSQVDRLLDISHHSKLDQMEAAFAAIGKRLLIEIRDAA
jgi:antitoxin HicB